MQIVKYVIFFILLVTSGYLGKLLSKKYVDRLKELEELKSALNIFESKIKFTYEPISEVFEDIVELSNKNVGAIFKKATKYLEIMSAGEAWEKALKDSKNNLKEEDILTLKTLSNLLRTN